jgi:hypothetical protein
MVAHHHVLHGVGQIPEEMKAIRDLNGLRCAARRALGTSCHEGRRGRSGLDLEKNLGTGEPKSSRASELTHDGIWIGRSRVETGQQFQGSPNQ